MKLKEKSSLSIRLLKSILNPLILCLILALFCFTSGWNIIAESYMNSDSIFYNPKSFYEEVVF